VKGKGGGAEGTDTDKCHRQVPAQERALSWWETAVVYQIYPRSFADSNGDGIGDLPGITDRLPYLADLGVDALWITPFYPSPLADGGYDVSDYRDVDPRLGTLDDFDVLVKTAADHQLRIIIDIVPNHTSSKHPWFLEALGAPPGSQARDRYIFRDGKGVGPPTDWRSHFGGGAWTRTSDGQWYCHLFDREQPDLNWDNAEVRDYFLDTLRFWGDRGVAGFRVDVAHALAKDLSEPLRSQPHLDGNLPDDGSDPLYDREEVHEIYRTWRGVFDQYDPPLMGVAETWYPAAKRTRLYARPSELGQVFDFSLMKSGWSAEDYRRIIETSLNDYRDNLSEGGGLTWVLSSHDVPRHASRLALPRQVSLDAWLLGNGERPPIDHQVGLFRARAATLMMLALPGSPYLYQGEELGLPEVADLPTESLRDPVWARSGHSLKGRDGCRVPIPWSRTGPSYGFGKGNPWLPQPDDWAGLSVEAQAGVEHSTLELYRSALRIRHSISDLAGFDVAWHPTPDGVLAFTRGGGFQCTINLSSSPHRLAPDRTVLLASGPMADGLLPPDCAAWTVPTSGGPPLRRTSRPPEKGASWSDHRSP
jgi:alpha-glucosidase